MKFSLLSLLTLAFVLSSPARAADSAAAKEIAYLIHTIEISDARFIRNGTEYSAKEGAAHLQTKLEAGGKRIKTAEDFIAGAATKSTLSGKPYLIKTPGGGEEQVGPWLSAKLTAYRASKDPK